MNKFLIQTNRIVMRPFQITDLDDLVNILSDREVTRFIPEPNDRSGIETRLKQWIAEYKKNGYGFLAFIHKINKKIIGYGGFIDGELDGKHCIELGYVIGKEYWQQGYASEAVQAIKDYGLNVLNFPELIATVSEGNPASGNIASKIGMKIIKEINVVGHPYPCYVFYIGDTRK